MFLFFLILPLLTFQQSILTPPLVLPNTCFGLYYTSLCPAFSTWSIAFNSTYRDTTLRNIEDFDRLVALIVKEKSLLPPEFQECSQSESEQLQWHTTYVCESVLKALPQTCSKDPRSLCRSTCLDMVLSGEKLSKNCYRHLSQDFCYQFTNSNCISGTMNEQSTCGFTLPLQSPAACKYCAIKHPDPCCKHLSDTADCSPSANSASTQGLEDNTSMNETTVLVIFITTAVLIVIILCIILFSIYRHYRHRQDQQREIIPPVKPERRPTNNIYVVVCSFLPQLIDELELKLGQKVQVLHAYDDGWAMGKIVGRDCEGAFPMACVEAMSKTVSVKRLSLYPTEKPWSRRVSSIVNVRRSEVVNLPPMPEVPRYK